MVDIIPFNKVVLYGHKLYQGEFSQIYCGFYRAFTYLKFSTYWYDDEDNLTDIDFTNTLFFSEGNVDSNIPIRNDCSYVLLNCDDSKYNTLPMINVLRLNIYTKDVPNKSNVQVLPQCPCIAYIISECKLYMPWATPLLPTEIKANMDELINNPVQQFNQACYIGTIKCNILSVNKVARACKENGIDHVCKNNNTVLEDSINIIKQSKYPINIVTQWENDNDYISQKVFEHISCCGYSITNSQKTCEFLDHDICYDSDVSNLISVAIPYVQNLTLFEKIKRMELIKDKHTYVSRIRTILKTLVKIRKYFA